jgi:hypothetical protein
MAAASSGKGPATSADDGPDESISLLANTSVSISYSIGKSSTLSVAFVPSNGSKSQIVQTTGPDQASGDDAPYFKFTSTGVLVIEGRIVLQDGSVKVRISFGSTQSKHLQWTTNESEINKEYSYKIEMVAPDAKN